MKATIFAAALALAAGAAQAAPFRIVTDGPGSVWVLDARSGALDWCRTEAASGPKVIDVFGAEALPREPTPRAGEPVCTTAAGTLSAEARTLAAAGASPYGATTPGHLWRAGYGESTGYGRAMSWGGYGALGYGESQPGVLGGIGSVDGFINILGSNDIDIDFD